MFNPSTYFCGPSLDLPKWVHVFPVMRTLELQAALQVGSHLPHNHLPHPNGHTAFDADQAVAIASHPAFHP